MIDCGCCEGRHETAAEVRECCAGAETSPRGADDRSPRGDEPPPPSDDWFLDDEADTSFGGDPWAGADDGPVDAPDATVALGAPPELGRSLVVRPGQEVPTAWAEAPRIRVDTDDPADAAPLIELLHQRWSSRTPVVIEIDGAGGATDLTGEEEDREPWRLTPSFAFPGERLAHAIWANAIDLRDPSHPRFAPLTAAMTAGARVGATTDAVDREGTAVWCDGGPLDISVAGVGDVVPQLALDQHRLAVLRDHEPTSELAPDQLAAVRHRGGPCRVISPAGSGKTRTLTERARHLLADWGLPARAVCLVAYNKRAADEMAERLPDLPGLQIRTMNALALAIVNGDGTFGDPRAPRPRVTTVDEREVRSMLDRLVDFPRRANTDPAALWIEALAKVRLGLRPPDDVAEDYGGDLDELGQVFGSYQAELDRRSIVDFDQQIYGAIRVLLTDPDARARARRACGVLLVDEFQDLTPAHMLLLRLLSAPRYDVFAVGDDDQTIYGYNGADPRWLIDFAEFFPEAASHPLTVNYRCPPAVVTAADNLLSHNRYRVAKQIRSPEGRGLDAPTDAIGQPLVVSAVDQTVEATVSAVSAHLADGAGPDEIVVLTRVNAGLAPVQVALGVAGVPVDRVSGPEWLQRTGVRAALAWLALAADPDRLGSASLQEAVRRPGRGISRMVGEWVGEQRSVRDLRGLAGRMKQERDRDKIAAFADDVEAIGRVGGAGAAGVLTHVRDAIGLGSAVNDLDTSRNWTNRASHGDDLDALIQLASLHDDIATFADWLREQLARRAPAGGRVQLHTVHRVKGLEWPHVVIHEASSRLFPHHLSNSREEERRIFHVALTRCSRSVTVVAPADAPSPFLAELGEKLDPADLPPEPEPRPAPRPGAGSGAKPSRPEGALADVLRGWRMDRARERDVPAYVIFNDKTLADLIARVPTTLAELGACAGIGPAKLDAFGNELLTVIATNSTPSETGSRRSGATTPVTSSSAPEPPARPHAPPARQPTGPTPPGLADALRDWRRDRAAEEGVPAYRIFSNKTLDDLCVRMPMTDDELLACTGIGPAKLEAFGDDLLAAIAALVGPEA